MLYKDKFHHVACIAQLPQSLGYWLDNCGITVQFSVEVNLLFSTHTPLVLEPIQSLIQWIMKVFFLMGEAAEA